MASGSLQFWKQPEATPDQELLDGMFQNSEGKKPLIKYSIPSKAVLQNKGEIKTFPNEQTWKEFITTRDALQEMLKGILQAEMKFTFH